MRELRLDAKRLPLLLARFARDGIDGFRGSVLCRRYTLEENLCYPQIVILDLTHRQKDMAMQLYGTVANLPLVCPHGHVDPRLFADPDYSFGTPVDLLLIPDHYIFRMLYSQGIALEDAGDSAHGRRPGRAGSPENLADLRRSFLPVSRHANRHVADARIRRTCSACRKSSPADSAQAIYDQIADCLQLAGYAAAPSVRAFQHRGAVHHRRRDGYARPSPGDPRVGLDGHHPPHLPPGCGRQPGYAKAGARTSTA